MQLSNFFKDFLVDCFVADLDEADATPPPTTSPTPDTAITATIASAEQNRSPRRRRRPKCRGGAFEMSLVMGHSLRGEPGESVIAR